MIIKCPDCNNSFLAPDDLTEGQKLKCGKCNYSWKLENSFKKLPEEIKPKATDKHKPIKYKHIKIRKPFLGPALLLFLIFISLIGYGAIKFHNEIIEKWPPIEKIYQLINIESSVEGEGLEFKNLNAVEYDDKIYLTGTIENTTNGVIKVPLIRVSNQTYIKANHEELLPNNSTSFETHIPSSYKPITVSF